MSSIGCSRCDDEAVMTAPYSGEDLCETHFSRSVERRVRRRIRQDDLFNGEAVTWLIGISGGKDSAVLATILADTFADNPKVSLQGVSIHEGIDHYRDESLDAARALADHIDLPLDVRTYDDVYDIRMDDVAELDPLDMAPCAYCGVLRRDILDRVAQDHDADLLLTGHNLDDEAQTALMNFLEGDLDQIAKHFDASLAPLSERSIDGPFIPRAKPLRDIPEKEVALYAQVNDIPAHFASCPHAERSFRGRLQSVLHDLESDHPGTRHSIMSGYEDLAGAVANRDSSDDIDHRTCQSCGRPATNERCRSCQLLKAIKGAQRH